MIKLINQMILSVIGGDERQLYISETLKNHGYEIRYYGVSAHGAENTHGSIASVLDGCGAVLLPLPVTKDGYRLNATEDIFFFDFARMIKPGTFVFAGNLPPSFKDFLEQSDLRYFDYYEDKRVIWENADITAEGAITLISEELPCTINMAKILVCGIGRIGKLLTKKLISMGADVTVAARKEEDLLMAEKCFGASTDCIDYRRDGTFDLTRHYDVIINTVPSWIFDKNNALLLKNSLYIELASSPYGGEFNFMRHNCRKYVLAAGLPGKYAPESAARAISNSLLNFLSEGGKKS